MRRCSRLLSNIRWGRALAVPVVTRERRRRMQQRQRRSRSQRLRSTRVPRAIRREHSSRDRDQREEAAPGGYGGGVRPSIFHARSNGVAAFRLPYVGSGLVQIPERRCCAFSFRRAWFHECRGGDRGDVYATIPEALEQGVRQGADARLADTQRQVLRVRRDRECVARQKIVRNLAAAWSATLPAWQRAQRRCSL